MAKNSGVLQVPILQILQITQHSPDSGVKGILLLSTTPVTKGLPLGVVQSLHRWSMSCAYGGSSLSPNVSSAERSPESLQVARHSSWHRGTLSHLRRGEDHLALVATLAVPPGAAGPGEPILFEATMVNWWWPEPPPLSPCEEQVRGVALGDTCTVDPLTRLPAGNCPARPEGLGGKKECLDLVVHPSDEQIYCW